MSIASLRIHHAMCVEKVSARINIGNRKKVITHSQKDKKGTVAKQKKFSSFYDKQKQTKLLNILFSRRSKKGFFFWLVKHLLSFFLFCDLCVKVTLHSRQNDTQIRSLTIKVRRFDFLLNIVKMEVFKID